MQVNAKGVWLCMRAEIRRMLDRKRGSIVNTASVAGLRAIAMQAIYTASKHAVAGLTRNAAVDYAASGLRINAVCPGGIHTQMLAQTPKSAGADRHAVLPPIPPPHPMNPLRTPSATAPIAILSITHRPRLPPAQPRPSPRPS